MIFKQCNANFLSLSVARIAVVASCSDRHTYCLSNQNRVHGKCHFLHYECAELRDLRGGVARATTRCAPPLQLSCTSNTAGPGTDHCTKLDCTTHCTSLHQVVLLEVELQDRVLHRGEHEPDVLRVCNINTMSESIPTGVDCVQFFIL